MSTQYIDFETTGDSGQNNSDSIEPVQDGEAATAAVFQRPSENLRVRTETLKSQVEQLKYLSDADRVMLMSSSGDVAWAGLPAGTFTASSDVVIKPFLSPALSTPATVTLTLEGTKTVTFTSSTVGITGRPRAYNGANELSVQFNPIDGGTLSSAIEGTPANKFVITYNSNAVTGTTSDDLQLFLSSGLPATQLASLKMVVSFSSTDTTVITPPSTEQRLSGAADAEKHVIAPSAFSTFFSNPVNKLTEGDVLCVWYDDLVLPSGGGRRQSIDENPENIPPLDGSTVPSGSLFLLRLYPQRLPGALPVATVQNGKLIFINNRVYGSGESGPLTSSGASYQGSAPDAFADGATLPASSFEDALDTIVNWLGSSGATPGGDRLGVKAVAGSPVFTSAGKLSTALTDIVSGINLHINDSTDAHAASAITNAPNTGGSYPGNKVSATTVQAAIDELDADKAAIADTNTFAENNTFQKSLYAATSSGSVGVGTATPTAKLQVIGASTVAGKSDVTAVVGLGTTSDLLLGSSSGSSPFVAASGANSLELVTNAATRIVVGGSGDVVVNTATTGPTFSVDGGIRARGGAPGVGGVNDNGYAFGSGGDNDSGLFSTGAGYVQLYTDGSKTLEAYAGAVGIGVFPPDNKLDVGAGSLGNNPGDGLSAFRLYATSSNDDSLKTLLLRDTAGSDWTTASWYTFRQVDGSDVGGIRFGSDGGVAITTAGTTPRLSIKSTGYVGLGTDSPTYLFHAEYTSSAYVDLAVRNLDAGTNAFSIVRVCSDTNTSAGLVRNSSTNSAYAGVNSLNLWTGNNHPIGIVTGNQLRVSVSGVGNVTVNAPASGVALAVYGNATLSGTLTAGSDISIPNSSNFKYATTKSGALYLSGGDLKYQVSAGTFGYGGPSLSYNRVGLVSTNGSVKLWTTFRLPAGAVITSITGVCTHGGGGAGGASGSISVKKYQIDLSPNAYAVNEVLSSNSVAFTFTAGAPQLAETSPISLTATAADRTVNNEFKFFVAEINLLTGASVSYNYLDMVVVAYDYTNVVSPNIYG